MCVVSMIMDRWNPHIPHPPAIWPPQTWPQPFIPGTSPGLPNVPPQTVPPTPIQVVPEVDNAKLRRLIETFHKAIEAAEEFDALTGQADCVDPEKAKLMERVEELERRLNEIEAKREVESDGSEEDR